MRRGKQELKRDLCGDWSRYASGVCPTDTPAQRNPHKNWSLCVCLCSWCGSHIRWGQPFRLRHLTTGHYLALTEDRGVVLQDRERSNTSSTAFCFRASKV